MIRRSPPKKLSAKKLAANGGVVPFSTISSPKKAIRKVNRKRKASEFKRCYHSKERVEFVKSLPCAACGVVGYSENAHLLGNGGMSRKADANTIGPLCGTGRWLRGCHEFYDEHRASFAFIYPDFDPEKVASDTQKLWEAANGR